MNMLTTFAEIIERLEKAGIDYMVVGSLASMTYGEPRLTKDMDVVVELKPQDGAKLSTLFPPDDFYCPPNEILGQEIVNRGQFNVIHLDSGLKVVFILKKLSPHAVEEFSRRVRVQLTPELEAWMATPEDVILKKLIYYKEGRSDKHIQDIKGILSQTEVDHDYLSYWIGSLDLQMEWRKTQE